MRALLAATRQTELLQSNQVLAHSIKLRNPYIDPMHLIQVDMLRRKRARKTRPRSTAPSPRPSTDLGGAEKRGLGRQLQRFHNCCMPK